MEAHFGAPVSGKAGAGADLCLCLSRFERRGKGETEEKFFRKPLDIFGKRAIVLVT